MINGQPVTLPNGAPGWALHSQPVRVHVKRTLGDGRGREPSPPREYTVEGSRWASDGRKLVHVG